MYFAADYLDKLKNNGNYLKSNLEYRELVISHLNKSFVISSHFGRFCSYIKAFSDKYVEFKS